MLELPTLRDFRKVGNLRPTEWVTIITRVGYRLQHRHIAAADFRYCGKEVKRKLEKGPVDHETDFKVKVYANGRVTANPETLRALADFAEREINKATGLSRRIIRHIRHGGQVKPSTMQGVVDFLTRKLEADGQDRAQERS